ncbi:hypothetical protein FACS189419_09850 [Planctomycetales bacterium]|nr:hypothetical protein FACS189419_09850 [Planctomycetales bacterium]
MMPKMSGYDVCRQLRKKYTLFDLPIIMLTAKNQVQDIVYGFQAGANDYIHKPFDKEELLARVKTLLELKGAMLAAAAANKAKGLFLANMSHELRTPLNAVVGLTHLLTQTHLNEQQRDWADKMNKAAASLLGIFNNIIDFSDADSGRIKLNRMVFNLPNMLSELTGYFEQQKPDSPVVQKLDIKADVPATLSGDEFRLKQVFINLLDNAYKFTERGTITITAAVARQDPNNVMLDFTVADTGIGMNKVQLEKVFEAFNQADNSATRKYGGAGIGLTLTREMVVMMGGRISVASEEGKGTVFAFSVPFQISEGAERISIGENQTEKNTSPEQNDAANEVLKGMRVLLVEDNKVNALIAAELMKSVGIAVTTAVNGEEALKRLAEMKSEHRPLFDLILMDLQMPVMDGYEATRIIKAMPDYRNIPVYALTAHAFAEERERCRNLGMEEHLTKPIDVPKFYEALRKIERHKTA